MTPDPGALVNQAYDARRTGNARDALRLYREAAIAFGGDDAGRAHCLRHIGDLAMASGGVEEARLALREAESLYRHKVADTLSLANTVRMLASLEDDRSMWGEARSLYARAAVETGFDLIPALEECDRHLRTST